MAGRRDPAKNGRKEAQTAQRFMKDRIFQLCDIAPPIVSSAPLGATCL